MNSTNYCDDCKIFRANDNGTYVCKGCGQVGGYDFCNERDDQIWLKKKSEHKIDRWMKNKLRKFVDSRYVPLICYDFMMVANVMRREKLLQKIISTYDYYVIRLASRRGVEQREKPKDLVSGGKTKRIFDDRLFGKVYPLLQWDQECECMYYKEWVLKCP